MLVFAVLAQEFYQRRADQDPLAPLEPENNYTNAYIRGFAQQAQRFSFYMANYPDQYGRIQNYIIWNEPDKDLPASHFAALVRHCKQQMVQGPHIYWGGIFIPLGSFPDQWHLDYIAGVYQWLKDKGLAGAPDHGPWPWDGINLNIHRRRDDAFIDMLFDGFENPPGEPHKGVSQIKSDKGDAGAMLVGEWGVTEEEYQSDSSSLSSAYNAIRRKVDVMFFLSHQEYGEAGVGTWGIRRWYTVPGEYHLQPDGGNPPGKTNLYGPYDTLVGS